MPWKPVAQAPCAFSCEEAPAPLRSPERPEVSLEPSSLAAPTSLPAPQALREIVRASSATPGASSLREEVRFTSVAPDESDDVLTSRTLGTSGERARRRR